MVTALSLVRLRLRLAPSVRFVQLACVVLGALLVPAPARASLALALDVPALVQYADRVVVADVLSVTSAWDTDHRNILSTIALGVRETLKGKPTARLAIVQVGGAIDGVVMQVQGQASFTAGERAVFFLRGDEQACAVVGLGQGKRPLRFDASARSWMVDPGDRSAAVDVDGEGRFKPAAPGVALSLDALRARLRASGRR
jgi:hypothetical protein